jgi:ADP-dependent NAD(P)H-hydrate dehydratase / NAD(P)H-hydrate epimerase
VTWPGIPWSTSASLSSAQVRQADVEAHTRFGIEPLQLMEVAGWQLAQFVDRFLGGVAGRRVLVVAGSGNNGGDALVAGRFLHQRGATVQVSIVPSTDRESLAARHEVTIRRLGLTVAQAPEGIDATADLIIDGLLGTGIRPPLRKLAAEIIAAVNHSGRPIIAVDVPSGIDADTGIGWERAIQATATVALAAPKAGLRHAPNAGRICVADIGMPSILFSPGGDSVQNIYRTGALVELIGDDPPQSGNTPI